MLNIKLMHKRMMERFCVFPSINSIKNKCPHGNALVCASNPNNETGISAVGCKLIVPMDLNWANALDGQGSEFNMADFQFDGDDQPIHNDL